MSTSDNDDPVLPETSPVFADEALPDFVSVDQGDIGPKSDRQEAADTVRNNFPIVSAVSSKLIQLMAFNLGIPPSCGTFLVRAADPMMRLVCTSLAQMLIKEKPEKPVGN